MYRNNSSNSFKFKHMFLNKKSVSINKYFAKYNFIKQLNNMFLLENKKKFIFSLFKNKKFSLLLFYNHFKLKKKLLFLFCSFCYSKIFLKVGLGFRKKYYKKFNFLTLNVGVRKWAVFKTFPSTFFFNVRRRNIFMFSNTKRKLYFYLTHLKYLKKETIYKVKGIMPLNRIIFSKKISRSILFARRVKFKAMKLKLTKKQKQRR